MTELSHDNSCTKGSIASGGRSGGADRAEREAGASYWTFDRWVRCWRASRRGQSCRFTVRTPSTRTASARCGGEKAAVTGNSSSNHRSTVSFPSAAATSQRFGWPTERFEVVSFFFASGRGAVLFHRSGKGREVVIGDTVHRGTPLQ